MIVSRYHNAALYGAIGGSGAGLFIARDSIQKMCICQEESGKELSTQEKIGFYSFSTFIVGSASSVGFGSMCALSFVTVPAGVAFAIYSEINNPTKK